MIGNKIYTESNQIRFNLFDSLLSVLKNLNTFYFFDLNG